MRMKKLLEWPMYASLSLGSDKHVTAGKTLKCLIKLMDRLDGIGLGYDEGMESRTVMVPANGMVYKLREELKNDSALLFGLIFLAYLDIGGEYFCLLHPLFAFMYTSYFCLEIGYDALKVNSAAGDFVNFWPQCNMQCLNCWPYMIFCYTDRVYEVLASHFYIIGLNSLV